MNFKQYFTEAEKEERLQVLRRATSEDFTATEHSERPLFVKQLLTPGTSWVIKIYNSTYPNGEEFIFFKDGAEDNQLEYFNKEAGINGGTGTAEYEDQQAIEQFELKQKLTPSTRETFNDLIDEL